MNHLAWHTASGNAGRNASRKPAHIFIFSHHV